MLKKPCYPLPIGYPFSHIPEFEDERQAQTGKKPYADQNLLNKRGPGPLDIVSAISPTTDIDLRHYGSNKQSSTEQPLPFLSTPPFNSSSIANETEHPAAQSSTYRGQQCHNCVKFADICDRHQPCSACTRDESRGECLSAGFLGWKFGLEGDLREEDNAKAREIERRLRGFF
jgi:hypothetical protein